MQKKYLELKTVIIIFIFTTLSIFSIIGVINLMNKIGEEKQANFVFDISLSFITAFVSAFIAYIVAIIQVKAENKRVSSEIYRQNKKNLNLLVIEMENNLGVITATIQGLEEYPNEIVESTQFSIDIFEMLVNKIDLPNELIAELLRETRKKNLIFCDESLDIQDVRDFKKGYEESYTKISNHLKNLK